MAENKLSFMSFIILGKDYGRKDRKRKKSYHSDETDSDVCEVKKRKQESASESSKVQMTMAQFVNKNSVTETTTSATVDTCSSLKLTADAAVEVYKYSHTKKSGSRNTLFVMSDKHRDLCALKKDLGKEYGLTTDARRYQVGEFNIEIGVTCSEKTYVANTQTEWENLRTRFYSGTGQYCLLGE